MSTEVKIKPLGARVVVEPLATDEKTAGGIIIPDTVSKEKPEQGIVVAVGPGDINKDGKRIPMDVKVGDKVLFSKYSPEEITIDSKEYFIIREDTLLAIIE